MSNEGKDLELILAELTALPLDQAMEIAKDIKAFKSWAEVKSKNRSNGTQEHDA